MVVDRVVDRVAGSVADIGVVEEPDTEVVDTEAVDTEQVDRNHRVVVPDLDTALDKKAEV